MSHVTNVLVEGDIGISLIAASLGELIGHELQERIAEIGNLYETTIMGVNVYIYDEPGLEDDCGIEFSKYRYVINYKRYSGSVESGYQIDLCHILALISASVISRKLNCECLVVDNLQAVVQSFPKPEHTL